MEDPLLASYEGEDGGGPPAENAGGPLVPVSVINRRVIVWDKDGTPVPSASPMMAKTQIQEAARAALSLPYQCAPDGTEAEFEGMSNVEVALVKASRAAAHGDLDALHDLLDRVLGKPKQQSEIKSVRLTYEDLLSEMARLEPERQGQDGSEYP